MKRVLIAMVMMVSSATPSYSAARSAYEISLECEEIPLYCLGFIAAVVDLHAVTRQTIFCVPQQVQHGQLYEVVKKHGRDHPEVLHQPYLGLVLDALRTAFPCK